VTTIRLYEEPADRTPNPRKVPTMLAHLAHVILLAVTTASRYVKHFH
jgi:hypothetical protein